MSELEPRNFLQPCLLLLLREQDDHGYGLVARLRPLHDGDGDAGGVYRALRGMERHGLVLSEWQASEVGPARRTYRITPEGRALLDAQAVELAGVHMTLHVFMDRYERLPGHRPREVMTHDDDRGAGRDGGVRATPRPRRGTGH
jgi:PadR family transcriptional regulator, regulatory protein PadR